MLGSMPTLNVNLGQTCKLLPLHGEEGPILSQSTNCTAERTDA